MRRSQIDIPKETLEHLYWNERLSIKAIADKLGLSVTPVHRSMVRHNVQRRTESEVRKLRRGGLGISKEQLEDLYLKQQLPLQYLSFKFEVGVKTLRKLLQDVNIPLRSIAEASRISSPKRRLGKNGHGHNWKGGRMHNANGYTMLWQPSHPRATKHGYVYEHIVIWEETHGEPLPRGWITHHLNGIKTDNRPENLIAMPRGAHRDLAKPFKARIRELETRIQELQLLKMTIA